MKPATYVVASRSISSSKGDTAWTPGWLTTASRSQLNSVSLSACSSRIPAKAYFVESDKREAMLSDLSKVK